MPKIELILRKPSMRRSKAIERQLNHVKSRVASAGRGGAGWSFSFKTPLHSGRHYEAQATLTYPSSAKTQDIERVINSVLLPSASASGWSRYEPPTQMPVAAMDEALDIMSEIQSHSESTLSMPDDWAEHFSHIYSRDSQIGVLVSAVRTFIDSESSLKYHCCLVGPPGCAKTELMRSLKNAIGEEHVVEYDATATTSAGAIKDLAQTSGKPIVLLIEEIEKCDESALRWLLSVLDLRGEIRKTNFHQKLRADVKVLCVATVNNVKLFEGVMSGALASRFPHKIHCPRPDRAVLEMILKREIEKHGGDEKWISPALDYALEEGITDPRQVSAICLCGADQLISGEYQRMLKAVKPPLGDGHAL